MKSDLLCGMRDELPKMRGSFEIVEKCILTGKEKSIYLDKNIITYRYKYNSARLLAGVELTSRYINRMAFGTGGHQLGNPAIPIPPVITDNALDQEIMSKVISQVTFPDDSSVRFSCILDTTEAVGFTITEAGLKFVNGDLSARKCFPGVVKTSSNVFTVYWTLYWS